VWWNLIKTIEKRDYGYHTLEDIRDCTWQESYLAQIVVLLAKETIQLKAELCSIKQALNMVND